MINPFEYTRNNPLMSLLSLWTIVQWWGCSLAGAKTGQRDEAESRPIFTLHYDAYQGFEEADHDVCFVDKYRLIHLEDGAEMTWKIEGHEVDRDAVLASLGDEAVDLQEVSYWFSLGEMAERGLLRSYSVARSDRYILCYYGIVR